MPKIITKDCLGCGACLPACPVDAISLNGDNKAVINDEICTKCGACIQACPVSVIKSDSAK